ncbi:hypothetical protein BaRGS_00033641 [Batillaria attramentaria]|uniref:Secreted protein n=1 Tax=Batillaria attramentaria TaxID=370345 RepID=A0ABD0JJG7_9CAEN
MLQTQRFLSSTVFCFVRVAFLKWPEIVMEINESACAKPLISSCRRSMPGIQLSMEIEARGFLSERVFARSKSDVESRVVRTGGFFIRCTSVPVH